MADNNYTPGPQNPGAYPRVGSNYLQWGELQGLVYDYARDAYFVNPNDYEETYKDFLPQEEQAPGLAESLIPVIGTTAAIGLGKEIPGWLADQMGQEAGKKLLDKGTEEVIDQVAQKTVEQSATQATQGALDVGLEQSLGGVDPASVSSTAPAEGGLFSADGFLSGKAPGTFGQIAGGLGAAKGAYDTFNAAQEGEGVRSGLTTLGMGAGGAVAGPLGAALGGLAGNVAGYGFQGDGVKNKAVRGVTALATGGLSELVPLAMKKSTKQYAEERYGNAMDAAATDADRSFIEGAYAGQQEAANNQVFTDGKFAGQQYDFEKMKGDFTGENVWGEYAFQEAFPDWISGFTEDQRRTIAQAALDENLLESDKGQILASGKRGNLDKLRQIGESVRAGEYQPVVEAEGGLVAPPPQVQPQAVPEQPMQQRGGAVGAYVPPSAEQDMGGGLISMPKAPGFENKYAPADVGGPEMPQTYPQQVDSNMWQGQGQQELPAYFEGAPQGQYRAPDGVNTISVDDTGRAISTLIGTAPGFDSVEQAVAGYLGQPASNDMGGLIAPPQTQRTSSLSPGIGLDGKPLRY